MDNLKSILITDVMYEFSFFRRPVRNSTPCRTVDVAAVFRYLVSGYADEETAAIAETADAEERRKLKRTTLDYVTPACICTKRGTHGMTAASGLMVIDIDHVNDPLSLYAPLIKSLDPFLIFVSPSGQGVKVIRRWTEPHAITNHQQADGWAAAYKEEFAAVVKWLALDPILQNYPIDLSGSDMARACYLCRCYYSWINPQLLK